MNITQGRQEFFPVTIEITTELELRMLVASLAHGYSSDAANYRGLFGGDSPDDASVEAVANLYDTLRKMTR